MNTGFQVFVQDLASNSFGKIPGSGIAGSCGNSMFNFLKNLKASVPFYIPTNCAPDSVVFNMPVLCMTFILNVSLCYILLSFLYKFSPE